MKKSLIRGTVILTVAGLCCRLMGFFYRIFLSQTIGAEGMGIYQLIFPIYNLCFALAVAGIQTALSRMIAASLAKGEPEKARNIFLTGLICSGCLSLLLSVLIRLFAAPLSNTLLAEPRCETLLMMLSFSLPLSTVHACINGYFFARRQTAVPASLQIVEQIVRITSSYGAYLLFLKSGWDVSPMIAVIGLVASEFAAMCISVLILIAQFRREPFAAPRPRILLRHLPEIFRLSFPLTLNRVLLNLLHSIEAIMIPWSLRRSSMESATALATFGVLTGMSLPLILFPTAITNSMATVLLPTVAEEQALDNSRAIRKLVKRTAGFAVLMGLLFAVIFFFSGPFVGQFLFDNAQAGSFIRTLSLICPFLYVNTTLASVINGLGKTFACFLINLTDLSLRILFIVFLIPVVGIRGYLYGLLLGEMVCTLLSSLALHHFISYPVYADSGRQTKKDVL